MMGENSILVSIKCTVYNHEPFLRQCLDGFVMQRTNFRFEAIVHDDASTDGSAAIIREYAAKYPDIIKPIYETENQYSKRDGSLRRIMNAHMRGKYVAMCEGDDYWTDPCKLQKQVDFLESHPDYVMCFHRYQFFNQDERALQNEVLPALVGSDGLSFDLDFYISNEWFTQPLTVVYRLSAFRNIHADRYRYYKDATLFYLMLKYGKGFVLPDVAGVYRLHNGGVFSKISHKDKILGNIKTAKSICEVEKTPESATFLKNTLEHNLQFVGLRFVLQNFTLLTESIGLMKRCLPKFSRLSFAIHNFHIMSTIKHLFKE